MKSKKNRLRNAFLLFIFAAPIGTAASVQITEVMYDLDGSDSGREWVEVTNTGSAPIDIGSWRLFENGTNHTLELVVGLESKLPSGISAIVVDKPEKFKSDWPSYTGIIFNSAFSLSNTGETLILRNEALQDIDSISYTSAAGAAGDGGSLQRLPAQAGQDAVLLSAAPTPGIFPGELVPVVPKQKAQGSSSAKSAPAPTPTSAKSVEKPAEPPGPPATIAQVAAAAKTQSAPLFAWLLGLVSIIVLGVAGYFFARSEQINETKLFGEEFEIVDN